MKVYDIEYGEEVNSNSYLPKPGDTSLCTIGGDGRFQCPCTKQRRSVFSLVRKTLIFCAHGPSDQSPERSIRH